MNGSDSNSFPLEARKNKETIFPHITPLFSEPGCECELPERKYLRICLHRWQIGFYSSAIEIPPQAYPEMSVATSIPAVTLAEKTSNKRV
jgi:hypothetical protein